MKIKTFIIYVFSKGIVKSIFFAFVTECLHCHNKLIANGLRLPEGRDFYHKIGFEKLMFH